MFGISKSNEEKPSYEKIDSPESFLKYPKPKISLMDLPKNILNSLKTAGYNVSTGTFGSPYKVELADGYKPVLGTPKWSNITEQEIIFIDLTPPKTLDAPQGEKDTPNEENDYWVKCNIGVIDPRPLFMFAVHEHFDRILKHGGIFVIFAQPRLTQDLFWAKIKLNQLRIEDKINWDNWSFLSNTFIQ